MKFLKLIQYQNLLLLAAIQFLFRYAFLERQSITLALNPWQYALLVLSTVLLMAAGTVIKKIFDSSVSSMNEENLLLVAKGITETTAYNLYIGLNITGVAIGFYLANLIGKPSFAAVFILMASLFYFYATSLRQIMILGNFIIGLLLSLCIVIIGIFDLFPIVNPENQMQIASLFSILIDYALFTFMIGFIREIVKDLENVDQDYRQGVNSLAVAIGSSRTAKIALALAIIPFILSLLYINTYYVQNGLILVSLYCFVFVLAPLLYFIVKIFDAKTKKDFHHLSGVLKLVLLLGLLSILVITLNIQYNA